MLSTFLRQMFKVIKNNLYSMSFYLRPFLKSLNLRLNLRKKFLYGARKKYMPRRSCSSFFGLRVLGLPRKILPNFLLVSVARIKNAFHRVSTTK